MEIIGAKGIKGSLMDNMHKNVEGMVKNIQDAEELEEQSKAVKDSANQFMRGSHDLEREMKARNRRINIVIICIVIAVLLYILVPIIVWATKSSESDEDDVKPTP